jgi:hypothetical protein
LGPCGPATGPCVVARTARPGTTVVRSIRTGAARMGSAGITRVLGRRRHPVVTRPPVLGVVRHAGLRAIRRAVGTPERRAHDRATFRKPLPNRCFCECRRQPWRRLAHATTPPRTVNGESDDFSSRARSTLRTDPCAMSNERPQIPFRRASVAIQRHENAATATATRPIISPAPSAATERPCAARLWESRRRHERCVRRRVPAPPSDGRERERSRVERARPRSQGPRERDDGAERTLAPEVA